MIASTIRIPDKTNFIKAIVIAMLVMLMLTLATQIIDQTNANYQMLPDTTENTVLDDLSPTEAVLCYRDCTIRR